MSHGLADLVATAMDEGSCFHDRQRLPASCGAESAHEEDVMTRWILLGMVLAIFVGASPVLSFHEKGDKKPHYVGYPVRDAKGRCWVQQVVSVPGSRLLSFLPPERWKGSKMFCSVIPQWWKWTRRTP